MDRATRPEASKQLGGARLPGVDVDPHPLGTWALQMGFDLWLRAFYRRVVLQPADFRPVRGALIASNHQRDVDGPMLGTVLAHRRGLHFAWPAPVFATREDLFRPGILARLTVRWPRPVSTLLGRVPLAWFFPLGHAEPIRRVREYTLGESLQALSDAGLAGTDAASVLNARGRRETGLRPGACTVRDALARRDLPLESWWGLRRLGPGARARIAPGFRATVAAQLAHFATLLDRGRSVYFAPEGTLSTTGHFGHTRAGFFRLARLAANPPAVVPMTLAYDALRPGRPRVVLRIGNRFPADPTLDRRSFDAVLRAHVLDLVTVTPSHLLSRYLARGPVDFTRAELTAWVDRSVRVLRNARPALDPLFEARGSRAIVHRRLRWLERRGVVLRAGDRFRSTCPRDAEPGWRTPANVIRYLDNNLEDLLPGSDRIPPC